MSGLIRNSFFTVLLTAFFVVTSISSGISQDIDPGIEEALKAGDTAKAINLIDADISLDPSNPWNYYFKGMIYFNRGKYSQAAKEFEAALDKRGKHYESLYQLGLCYLNMGELDKAEKAMEEGRKKDKKNKHRFEDGYGLVMLAKQNWQEADRAFRQALVDDSLNPMYHIHLGDANFYQGVPALAIIEYEKALQVDTAGLEVYYHWAEACLEMKDYTCAIEKLRIVLTKDSTHAPAWMRAGGIYFKAGLSSRTRQDRIDRFRDAIGSYKRYVELSGAEPDSSNVRVFFELAMAYTNLNGFEDAAENFEKVLAIPMEPRDVYFHYGKALWYNKNFEKAAEMLKKHLEWVDAQGEGVNTGVDKAEVYQYLGDSYFYRDPKDFVSAVDWYKKSYDLNTDQKRVVQNIAVAYHSLKSYSQAIEFYNKRIAFGIDSSSSSIYKNAGYCALNIANGSGGAEDDIDELDEDLGDSPVDNGIDPNVNYYQVAVDYLVNYMEFNKDDLSVQEAIANTYLYQLQDCTNGVEHFEKVLVMDPNNCGANKALGYAYFGGVCTKNYTKALGYLTKAQTCLAASSGECSDVPLILWIAQAYHLRAVEKTEAKQDATDDFRNAHTWYVQCLKCEPNNKDAKLGKDQTEYEF
ncbi:MAG: tetratricopeptide repeat protein [Candidatus Zixiibacteriota bacterium]